MPDRSPAMIANARMYAVTPDVAAHWRALFDWIGAEAGVPIETIEHAAPRALHDLWQRPDLGCAFMCGYPWATWSSPSPRPVMLGVVVPSPQRYGGRSAYCSDIVVRADSAVANLADLRGCTFAFTTPSSQSGYQAPRALFAARFASAAPANGFALFRDAVGPLVTPRAVVNALLTGAADAGPLDSYWHDLLRRHEPETAARLRVIASTPMTPMPPLAGAAGVPASDRARLEATLIAAGSAAALRDIRDALLIARFAAPEPAEYAILSANARAADAAGYPRLQ